MLKGSDEPCAPNQIIVTSRSGGLLNCVPYFIFFYSFRDQIMIKIFLSLRTIKYRVSYNYYLDHNDGTCALISVHFSIIIKDIIIKGIKVSQSKSICFIFLCTFSTAPYGGTNTINTCPCSLLIGSSWPGGTRNLNFLVHTYIRAN